MSSRAKALLEAALTLSVDEREALAGALLASLGSDVSDVDGAWAVELEKRARESLDGTAGSRDFDQALADIASELHRIR